MRQTTIFDDSVADRIERLLARCDAVRRGTEINRPVRFNADGERHARSVAARDVVAERPTTPGGGSVSGK